MRACCLPHPFPSWFAMAFAYGGTVLFAAGLMAMVKGNSSNLDLLRFSGEALVQSAAIFSNWFGLVKSSAEWRLTGL